MPVVGAPIRVFTPLGSTGGGWYFSETKTARSRRQIPLPASTMRALAEHRRQQAAERLKAGATNQQHDLVFATPEGGPLAPRNLKRRHFRPILERDKLPLNFRLYDLRHSCATLLLSAGEHPKVVSERLGHATITLTLDVYSHVLPRRCKRPHPNSWKRHCMAERAGCSPTFGTL